MTESNVVKSRSEWIDSAKGVAVTLVIVYHVINGLRNTSGLNREVTDLYTTLSPIITPLFFVIGGFFAAKSLNMNWRTFIDRRVLYFMYFYFLWSAISIGLRAALSGHTNSDIDMIDLVYSVYKPIYTMWFLYAFALTFLIAKLTKSIPVVYVMLFAAAIQAYALPLFSEEAKLPLTMAWFFPFFLIGMHGSEWIRSTVARMTPLSVVACFAVALTMIVIGVHYSAIRVAPIYLTISTSAAFGIMGTGKLLSGTRMGALWSYVGERSFAVYLLHFAPVAGFRIILMKLNITNDPWIIAPIAIVMSLVTCVIAYDLLMKAGLTFLFERPEFLSIDRPPRKKTIPMEAAVEPGADTTTQVALPR